MPPATAPILQSCLSFLVPKSMFKEVSQCIPAASTLYFGQINPFHYSPLPFSPIPHYSTAFNTYHYIIYLHRCYTFWFCWCSIILFLSLLPQVLLQR
jgi:hypothetical protein